MISIKYSKNILDKDAFKIVEVPGHCLSLSEVKENLRDEIDLEGLIFIRDGVVLDDLSSLNESDDIFAVYYLEFDPATWAAICSAVWTALVVIYWAAVAYSVYMAISASRSSKQNYGADGSGMDDSSATYSSWDGIQTTADVGIPIPVVYGEHAVGGNIINAFISNDGDKNYLNLLLALCEGEIESISDVMINDQPVANFTGVDLYTDRLGTNNDSLIPNFEDLFDNYTVAQGLNALDANYIYTTAGSDIEGFEIQVSLPSGLFQQNTANGNIESWSVGVRIEHRPHSGGSWVVDYDTTVNAQQRTDIKRYFRVSGLSAGKYDIRVTRTTEAGSFYKTGDLLLSYVVEIRTQDLIYPNVAKLGIKALATDQLSGSTPQVSCIVRGKKVEVPQIMYSGAEVPWEDYYWDPVAEEFKRFSDDAVCSWDGVTWVTRWSANPVWCLRDILINPRYGLGEHIDTSLINRDAWIPLAQYCDEKVQDGVGGYEKRSRMDVVLDSAGRATDILQQLMSCFRGILFFSENSFKLVIDKPAYPAQLFGEGNILSGSLTQSFKAIKDVPNVIEVQYLDKDQDYKQNVISAMDEEAIAAGDPIRKQSIRLFVTRTSQALREAKYQLMVGKYLTRSVSFKSGVDSIRCQAGDVIAVSNDFTQWGFSGRVTAGSSTILVKLDRPVTIESGKTYKVLVRLSDDTIEERTVINPPGVITEASVSVAFSQTPAAYDVYILGEVNKVKKDFRIVSIRRSNSLECDIQAIEYNESIFNTDSIIIPTINSSALSLQTPNVESLNLTERLVRMADGTIESTIDVWFRRPDANSIRIFYKKAKIYISDDGGLSWIYVGETSGSHFQIIGGLIDGTTYKVAVVSVGINDVSNPRETSPVLTLELVGKSDPPSNVGTFLVNQSRDRIVFTWSGVSDMDLFGYEIRYGESWEAGEVIATQVKSTRYTEVNMREGNSQRYWIKAIDTSGNYSLTAKEAIVTIDNIPFTNIVQEYQEQTGWIGTKSNTSKVGDNLEVSAGQLSGTYITPVRDLGYVASFKIGINTVVSDATSASGTWDEETGTWAELSPTERWSGDEVVGATAFEIRISEDNVTWDDWRPWQSGDYKCRYFQIRMTLLRSDLSKVIQCSEFNYYADLPDVDEVQDATVSVAADGALVTFVKTFHEDPALNVTILSGSGAYWKASGISTTGVTIKLYDTVGSLVTGSFRIHIHGV